MVLLWRAEPFRVRRGTALLGCLLCLAALAGLSLAVPTDREDEFYPHQYVSKFARSAAVAAVDLANGGVLEADPATEERLNVGTVAACPPSRKLPHIVMVFDESSFDVTMMPNVKVAADYRERFRSSDGQTRAFVVEGAGGPSWYTEYNVLTGLSVRSYGRFAESVTRLAAGRSVLRLHLAGCLIHLLTDGVARATLLAPDGHRRRRNQSGDKQCWLHVHVALLNKSLPV